MNETSKYYPLYQYLSQSEQEQLVLTVDEIEAMLAIPLPESARTQRAWWSNRSQGGVQAAAWMAAGYKISHLNLDKGEITFRKKESYYHIPNVRKEGGIILWNGELIKALREQLGLSQVELAEKLGMRHTTISEWETGLYTPKRSTSKYLTMIAEEAGFQYGDEN